MKLRPIYNDYDQLTGFVEDENGEFDVHEKLMKKYQDAKAHYNRLKAEYNTAQREFDDSIDDIIYYNGAIKEKENLIKRLKSSASRKEKTTFLFHRGWVNVKDKSISHFSKGDVTLMMHEAIVLELESYSKEEINLKTLESYHV